MQEEDKGRLLTAGEVAAIWNERALAMGYSGTHYTRFSVRRRRENGFIPAQVTAHGYLYWEKDAREISLRPHSGAGEQTQSEDKPEEPAA